MTDLETEDPEPEVEAEREKVLTALRDVIGDHVTVDDNPGETVRVRHRTAVGTYTLRLGEESSGTRTWIGLLGPVLSTLQEGSVLCVDELDARLHPYLSDALVGLFQSPRTNVHGAQLVFSTHEASLLGRNSRTELFRDQVWFTEKEPESGATRIFPSRLRRQLLWLLLHFTDVTGFRTTKQTQRQVEQYQECGYSSTREHLVFEPLQSRYDAARTRAQALRSAAGDGNTGSSSALPGNPYADVDVLVDVLSSR